MITDRVQGLGEPAKHTPTPWEFEAHNGFGQVIDGEPMPFGYISVQHGAPIFELQTVLISDPAVLRANAELIVRAVNCHADLLAALHGMIGLIQLVAPTLTDPKQRDAVENNHRVVDARAAIAKAEGRQP